MSTYSNRLQPALQNLWQHVRFFHPRSSCPSHISVDVCGGRKSLIKPVTLQNISSCSVLSPEIIMHDDAYISGRSENNIKCVVHDDLGWKNRTTRYILPRHWLYEWFSQFHRCGTYSVLSRSPSNVIEDLPFWMHTTRWHLLGLLLSSSTMGKCVGPFNVVPMMTVLQCMVTCRNCWSGDTKGKWPVKSWVLVCGW